MLIKDNIFLDSHKKLEETEKIKYFEQGLFALCFERPMEAAHFFYLLEKEKNSAVFFNLALCFFKAKNYQETYQYLQRALAELPRNREVNLRNKNISSLEKYEEEGTGYQNAMLYLSPIKFPDLARENIIRLMVDVLFLLNQEEEMRKMITSLKNKNYKNIKEKLERSLA